MEKNESKIGERGAGIFLKQSVVDWAAEIYCMQFHWTPRDRL